MSGELPSSEEEVKAMLESAVLERASHIRKEAETITMASVRRLLESDLGLEKSALDAHKVLIRQLVDAVLLSSENAEAEAEEEPVPEEARKRVKKSSGKKKAREENGSADQTEEGKPEEKDHMEPPKKKKQKKDKVMKEESQEDEESGGSHAEASVSISEEEVHLEASKGEKKNSKSRKEKEEIKEDDENGGGSQSEVSEGDSDVSDRRMGKKASSKISSVKPVQNKRIEHLKRVIKACGLTIPPQVYKSVKQQPEDKHDKCLIKELEHILSRRGLSSDPSEKEIKAAKRRIAREKDMEGIDTTNIILEPRGRRAASQFFAPVYNPPPVEYDSELDDAGDEDEEEEESDNAANGSEEEKHNAAADDTDNSE